MTYSLENDQARVAINSHGAELSSFIRKDLPELGELEYIWPAEAAVWGRHAPVLFPIVGRLANDTYRHQGHDYHLPQHGFARDREFTLVRQSPTELVFELRDDAASRASYPFGFVLSISYRLRGAELTVDWQVQNPAADTELLFSIGAHPAFRCPLLPEEKLEDYYFQFDHPVTAPRHLLQGGLLTGETAPLLTGHTELPLTYDLFAQDALVLKHFDFTRLNLRSCRSARAVRVRFDGFPYLGLWTKGPGAPFVCIEPWQGIAGSVGGPQELADKEGILTLAPGGRYAASYTIAVE
ncbi:Galactose mutarotase [Hymenobacter daecheongensis DSM 21074]|uniref:Galactose mutarotase n=1 Tax=Hymenobacter daecheongensis DSM 21074 TaxID=1121955 RepID=A0A1M6D1B5_9BACT|nr:aldose 1-epimerase family protein [Hymenobacter daecheongensis]SHI66768.1 Galactose mutarotase [Hymenobacter daecheongensis DSM 21074]